tara:strand:+ start:10609 stop:10848 length:240 start_codon:yes stop_codon:yes gene_type:complete
MESVIKISWRGDQSEIMRAIESVKPDDSDSFTIEYAKPESDFLATITIKSNSLSSAKATADDILACLGAASVAADLLND